MNASLTPQQPDPPRSPDSRQPRHRALRIAGWIAAGFVVLLLVVGATIAILLNSTRFHDYVLAKVESEATQSLGVPVVLQNFALHFSNLSLDLYGLTVSGANPYPNPPLLQVQYAEVGVRIVSILHQKWYLDNLRIDNPVVQVFVDKDGNSNLPTIKSSSNSSSHTTIFDLGVRHAILDHGEIFYNSRPSTLAADLHDVNFLATFNNTNQMYSGNLGYTQGRVIYGAYHPLVHDFDAQFDLTPSTLQLHHARISSGDSQINLVATATNFSSPSVQAQYDITVDGGQFAKLLENPSIPAGLIHASGSAQYQAVSNQPALNSVIVNGDITSNRLTVKTPSLSAAINNLAAHYSLANGDATLHDLRAGILGGEVTAEGTMKRIGGDSHTEATASLKNISLAEATRLAGPSAAKAGVNVAGVVNANATASWGKTMNDLVAHADATIRGSASGKAATPASAVNTSLPVNTVPSTLPVDSAIHATYTASNGQIALTDSYLRTPKTSLTMNGTVSNHSSLALRLQANDLNEVATLANLFSTPTPGKPAQPLSLSGSANFQGTVQGSTTAPHLTGQLAAQNVQVNGTGLKVLRTNVDVSPTHASLQSGDLELDPKGKIAFSANAGLSKWSFTKTSPVQVELDATQMSVADLTKLAGQQIPVTGTLNAHVSVHGSELNPQGNGSVTLSKVTAYDEPINSIQVNFNGTGDQANADLSVQLPAGSVESKVSVRPKDKTYTAQVNSSGIELGKLHTVAAKNLEAAGTLSIHASGQGSFDNPQLAAELGIPTLSIAKQTVQGIDLKLNVANHVGDATLISSAIHTSIQAKAHVNLTGDYNADAALDTQGIPLQPLVATYAPDQASTVAGETEVHATLHGPLKNQKLLEAHVTVPYLRASYNNQIQLATTGPIHADYKNGVVDVQHSAIHGTDTDLQFEGSIPVQGNGPMSLLLQGTVNLQLAQLFDPDVRSSGEMKFNINSHGQTSGGDLGGEIDVINANYASGDLPVGLQNGNGVLTLTTNRVNISHFEGTVGGGKVTAQGGIAYRPNVQFDLGLSARGIRMLYPAGMRETVDANIRLSGSEENARLGGTVNLADVSFTPAFDLSSFVSQFSGGVATPPSQGLAQNINLNLALHSTNDVNLVSRELSINGTANLQVRGTAADPVILGRVDLNSGDIILNGDRFVLAGGTIQFVNPSETEPVVNASITTTIQEYNISLRFNGPVAQLRTQYTSDPALPQADIVNLLAFGSTTEASAVSSADTTTTQTGESLVASQVSSQVTSRLAKVAGISQLSISPVLGNTSGQNGAGANITIQQRVTGNLFVTFSTDTASTQSQVIQGQYQVSPRVAVSATRNPNGGVAVDALIKNSW